ncbi:MAG: response regulator [Bacteroidales bacterium]|jgi:CheY-like chemotaxis protein|nr:response regulator [Bacteroidales bacterium]MDX9926367.1 response regulator [Bacteroidales bacterium]HNX84208.1 response regulator [Bacteroidales bacterium]HPS96564.1 response regulator [Bacteroidales bacterium]
MEKVSPQTDILVYVVDDDPVVTSLVSTRLEGNGYAVRAFAYAEDCIAALGEIPDLIILDYYFLKEGEIPMNGMEAYDEITRLAPEVPVIMLSAQEKGEVVLEFARKGIADYVIKDSDLIDNLLMAVKEVLER